MDDSLHMFEAQRRPLQRESKVPREARLGRHDYKSGGSRSCKQVVQTYIQNLFHPIVVHSYICYILFQKSFGMLNIYGSTSWRADGTARHSQVEEIGGCKLVSNCFRKRCQVVERTKLFCILDCQWFTLV